MLPGQYFEWESVRFGFRGCLLLVVHDRQVLADTGPGLHFLIVHNSGFRTPKKSLALERGQRGGRGVQKFYFVTGGGSAQVRPVGCQPCLPQRCCFLLMQISVPSR